VGVPLSGVPLLQDGPQFLVYREALLLGPRRPLKDPGRRSCTWPQDICEWLGALSEKQVAPVLVIRADEMEDTLHTSLPPELLVGSVRTS
jgi:hypothetical protein